MMLLSTLASANVKYINLREIAVKRKRERGGGGERYREMGKREGGGERGRGRGRKREGERRTVRNLF